MQQEKGRANSLRQARLKVQVLFCVPINVQSNVKQVIQTVTITLFVFGFPSVMNTSHVLEKPKLEVHMLWIKFFHSDLWTKNKHASHKSRCKNLVNL